MPYDINLSLDPFDNYTQRTIQIKGSHPLLGLQLKMCKLRNIPQIVECLKGTPVIRIPRWRSEIINASIIAVDNQSVQTIDHIQHCIQQVRQKGYDTIDFKIVTMSKITMHPQLGIPQLYHDQLNIIGQHLWDIKNHPEWQQDVHQTIIQPHVLTLKLLKKVVVMDKTWINLQTKQNIFKIAAIK